jgi:hypothetical protein
VINQEPSKKESFARRLIEDLSSVFHFSAQETIYIIFLAVSLTFFSTIAYISTESDQFSQGAIVHNGFPFDNVRHFLTFRNGTYIPHMSGREVPIIVVNSTVDIAWSGAAMNLMVYALFSFVVVKAFMKIKEKVDFYSYNKK